MKLNNVFLSLFGILLLLFLSQCCSSKEQIDENPGLKMKNSAKSTLPFGTAEISGTILKLLKENSKTLGLFKIDTVHGYGPSTRPIGVGSELTMEISSNTVSEDENTISEVFQKNSKHRLMIQFNQSGVGRENKTIWRVIGRK
jgi:hypothetical protein